MSIVDQLQINRFQDEWHQATVNILFTNNWLTKILELRASKKDITLQQFNVLRILRGQYPKAASNKLIKSRMITSMPDISRLVERLVAKGLVARTQNNADKRSVDLVITDKGFELLEDLEEEMSLSNILSQNLSQKEALQLSKLLDKLRGE